MTTVSISSFTNPITAANQASVVAAGLTNVSTNTVSVSIVDSAGTTVTVGASVAGTSWSIAASDVSALADGILIYQATATPLSGTAVFVAKAAEKNTTTQFADYIDIATFRDYIKDPSTNDSAILAQCITAASRAVDQDTGRAGFGPGGTAIVKYFNPCDAERCELEDSDQAWDIYTTSGLIVQTDTAGSGAYSATWTINTDFILEPINSAKHGVTGWPYESIKAVGNRSFTRTTARFHRPSVKITAKFGWADIPTSVVQATLLMTNGMYKRGEAPFGVAGFDAFGAVRVRNDPMYWQLLRPFIRASRLVA